MASSRDEILSFLHPPASSPIAVSNSDSYLMDSSRNGSASGSFQNDGFLAGMDIGQSINVEAEFGFSRPDFRQHPLAGTVDYYERHVFLCYKNPRVWPARIEAAEFDRLPRLLAAAVTARKPDMKRQTRLTICEGNDGTETSNGDVLIFPDMVRYRRLTHFDVDNFVEEVLVKDGEWCPGNPEPLRGWFVFVCCHASRDKRCGVCGPALITKFNAEIEMHGLRNKVSVSPCSHVGGSRYAGNVIIYGPIRKRIAGHWYGYVTPDDVCTLLERHVRKGKIVDSLWRGEMGLTEDEQKSTLIQRIQLNGTVYNSSQPRDSCTHICGSHVEGSCCQSNTGLLCCQSSPTAEAKESSEVKEEKEVKSKPEEDKFYREQMARFSSRKGASTRKGWSMPSWLENWEPEDTYATVAVVCTVVYVAFTYKLWKNLS